MKIQNIFAQEILDSRGIPTIACETTLQDGATGWSAIPSGSSTGQFEAVELRDNDLKRFQGKGVLQAISHINDTISHAVIGIDASDQKKIDSMMIELDGTDNKSKLGANAILAVSLSSCCAQAKSEKKELFEYLTKFNPQFNGTYIMPIPEMNVMNGGKHANWATDIQEYMLFPIGAKSIADAIRMNAEVYQTIKLIIKSYGYTTTVGDEGGFAPNVFSNEEPFQILKKSIAEAGYEYGKDIALGVDAAASEFYSEGTYQLKKEDRSLTGQELIHFYQDLISKYQLVSMEDVFDENDWDSFQKFLKVTKNQIQLVGDDIYVTNIKRLQKGIDLHATNSILIKLNQIGTLTETIEAILLSRKFNLTSIISHRSGETEDTFIADFAVAMGCGQIKSGAPCRSERVAKYNRLLRIERILHDKATFAKYPFSN